MDWDWRALRLIIGGVLCVAQLGWGRQHKGGFITVSSYHDVPPSPHRSVEIGNFYLRKGAYRGALSRFREAIRSDSDYAPAYLGLGKVYEKMGRDRRALEAYETYLNDLPSDRDAERAKGAHKAIARLKRQLAAKPHSSPPSKTVLSSAPHD